MKRTLLPLALGGFVLSASLTSCGGGPDMEGDVEFQTMNDSLSYAIGQSVGMSIYMEELQDSINFDVLIRGIHDAMDSSSFAMTPEEANGVLQAYSAEKQRQAQEKFFEENAPVRMEGEKYLAEIAKEEGVQKTPSGLMYKILEPGGQKPGPNDIVKVHYVGKLVDGTVFDSSIERGEPIEFPLNGVIRGWGEGMQLVGKGGKIMLYVPYELAYGERGAGQSIPPFSTLTFEVELLDVKPGKAPQQQPQR